MYSNNKGFNLIDILIKIIFFILFIFILTYLFPQVKDLQPFYNNIFRENISYMKEAAENHFNNNLPTEMGETKKLTLKEMIDQNLIIPFVDKDNNSCNLYQSYAEIIKVKEGYKLRVNLVCNNESDFIERTLGCNNFCDGVNCKNLEDACKNCDTPKTETPSNGKCTSVNNLVYYQFKKSNTEFSTSYYCEEGYSLRDKTCYRTVQTGRIKGTPVYDPDKTTITYATRIPGTTYKESLEVIKVEKLVPNSVTTRVSLGRTETVVPGGVKRVCDSSGTTTEQVCTTTTKTESYSCNCKVTEINGKASTTCSTCTRSVPVQSCSNVTVSTGGGCRDVQQPSHTEYSCTSEATGSTGSGSSLQCYKDVITTEYVKEIVNGCPADADGSTGSRNTLQCYKLKTTADTFKCNNANATRVEDKCYITTPGAFKGYTCSANYKQDGDYCYLETEESKSANVDTSSNTSWLYEWSTLQFMDGWTRTGQTKTVSTVVSVPCK